MAPPSLLSRVTDAAGGVGAALLGRVQDLRLPGVGTASVKDDPGTAARRWRAVTVLTEGIDTADALPAPLAAFGDRIEVRATPAPGDKGTELAARFRAGGSDEEIQDLRAALREAKQLIEVGEVLRLEPQSHGPRPDTLQGALIDGADERAAREGVL
jgi:hypothetical protein